ncbi:MAG: hypothetical protein LBJ25_07355, partial [Candidatus Margulisbacteria bacterium]|nr:hypothetical protein [Candidatus Margulisiibacteriota bacterium]
DWQDFCARQGSCAWSPANVLTRSDALPDGDQPDQTGANKTIQIEHTNSAQVKRGRVLKLFCETKKTLAILRKWNTREMRMGSSRLAEMVLVV